MMDRRQFVGAVAGGMLFAPFAVEAQPQGKVYRIGYPSMRAGPGANEEAFLLGLRDLGYVVGRNLVIDYRWANNDIARFEALVEELVRLNVDIIVTATGPAVRLAMRATRTIPIVMATASDPLGGGLVASLDRPGGNVTGMSMLSTDLAGKRLQLLRELVPGVTRVAVLGWRVAGAGQAAPGRSPTELQVVEAQAAGRQMDIGVSAQEIVNADDLPRAFFEFKRERVQALIVQSSRLTFANRATILEMAAQQRLPDVYEGREFVDAGGLVSYGPNIQDLYRRAASYVDKILRGAKPADLPVEQPTKFELVINLKTAKALGLTIPQSVLARADEVVQ